MEERVERLEWKVAYLLKLIADLQTRANHPGPSDAEIVEGRARVRDEMRRNVGEE